MFRVFGLASFTILAAVLAAPARAAPPRYDHVVIVIEENRSYGDIIGNTANAPYINSLAVQGVSFTNFFAVAHPSQADYLHLFCGSAMGVTTSEKPAHTPFSTPNLGAGLIAAGFTFTGYSEDLPAAGDAKTIYSYNAAHRKLYARKHNPWANWQDAKLPTPANRLPPSVNQPFTSFPTDFTALPTVSIVIPNQQNDMHDGTIKMADDWLAAHLGAYATWAVTHNSLLIVTWDEDDREAANKIPTIFVGAELQPGVNAVTWTHHNLLRMLEDMYALPHAGSAAQVAPINGVFTGEVAGTTLVFQQGANGYGGTVDTQIRQAAPKVAYGAKGALSVDLDDGVGAGLQRAQSLVRFDGLVGAGANQVPAGSTIVSAKLVLATGSSSTDNTGASLKLHRMLVDWSAASTWKTLSGGVSANDGDASAAADFAVIPAGANSRVIFDATAAAQAWANGSANYGWVLLPTSVNNWRWLSSEFGTVSVRPMLEVTYRP